MRNRKLVASVASACTLGLVVGAGAIAVIDAGAAAPKAMYVKTLTGAQQVPPGPPGSALGTVKVSGKKGTVCVKFKDVSASLLPSTAAHIHMAPVGVNGPIVVPLAPPSAKKPGKAGKSKACASPGAALIADLIAHPNQYYLNIHNVPFPNGAIRAQLG
jgi:CHRD domain-containing protein